MYQLLQFLIHSKVLANFELGKPMNLVVDASDYVLGAVLEQEE